MYGAAYNEISQLWVAAGNTASDGRSTLQYSTDGLTWSNAASGGFSNGVGPGVGYAVATGNPGGVPFWVAVGDPGNAAGHANKTILWSTDGNNWNSALSGGFSQYGKGVAFNGGQWIAVGVSSNSSNVIQVSYDGSNWSNVITNAYPLGGNAVAWNPVQNLWVAAMNGGLQTSDVGSSWNSVYTGGSWYGITHNSNVNPYTTLSPSTITTQTLTASSITTQVLSASTLTGQYNYTQSLGSFASGDFLPISNPATSGLYAIVVGTAATDTTSMQACVNAMGYYIDTVPAWIYGGNGYSVLNGVVDGSQYAQLFLSSGSIYYTVQGAPVTNMSCAVIQLSGSIPSL
jgi:hypothetical protein